MSSMVGLPFKNIAILALPLFVASAPATAEQETVIVQPAASWTAADWDNARAQLVSRQPGRIAPAIAQWQQLSANKNYSFGDYAGFLLTYPGLPDEEKLRSYAEARLDAEQVPNDRLVAFFDRFPPLTNPARAQYALALMGTRPAEAVEMARSAWRGGSMDSTVEAAILAMYGTQFTQADHDARMDALLWSRDRQAAERLLAYTSPDKRGLFTARLAILQGGDGWTSDAAALTDPGYLWNRSRELRTEGRDAQAVELLANRPPLASRPQDETAWIGELLNVARLAPGQRAQRIAASVDDAFAPGEDISTKPYKLRDDYTSLMWLGGTRALWELGDAAGAAPLFYRYGAAARTPQTRSKGFYWAGLASEKAGQAADAQRYFEMAADYSDRYYGMLALEKLGRPVAIPQRQPIVPTEAERATFMARPLTQAVMEVARDAPWNVGIRFYRELANQAKTPADYQLAMELAQNIGRRDLAVILADAAAADGHESLISLGFPTLVTPSGTDWTMVHAISRQESQFAENAISHAGARGLMQLMPGTAREQAGRSGMTYMSSSLIEDPAYNVRLGDGYFQRMLGYYDGSYPLAVAAYNAGPGNVNKWLRANGDPRTGSIQWIDWIEQIPFFETRNYVQRVLENAAVYETLHPDKASARRTRQLREFLR
ncbi:lytic transglycosylase domain-containing protein [Altericroceibacterium xinjiangense]|uniref:lytic transglycosylase domain-containing protein n=1 Tax=Altericroceibacterium xinjiangense TaxID=762261 RepID=UPI000F7DEFF4|nr:lytic transglycosylase domain-containing protein [Altericroceibacterium xinjiangense]